MLFHPLFWLYWENEENSGYSCWIERRAIEKDPIINKAWKLGTESVEEQGLGRHCKGAQEDACKINLLFWNKIGSAVNALI